MHRYAAWILAATAAAPGAGCTGNFIMPPAQDAGAERPDAPPPNVVPPPSETGCGASSTPLQRLTRAQVDATLQAALGVDARALVSLPPDGFVGPFEAGTGMSEALIRSLMDVAERAGDAFAQQLDCEPNQVCVDEVLNRLGPALYRRPLTDDERSALSAIQAEGASTEGSFARGIAWMVGAAIQAPDFLYVAASNDRDLASRLAYFLWNGPPDPSLLAAAEAGELSDPDVLQAQAARMLDDSRSRALVERFVVGWLDLRRLSQVAKSEIYLRFSQAAQEAMKEETVRFADAIMRGRQGNLHTLMTARWSYLTEPLFAIYGQAIPPSFNPEEPVSLLYEQRYGILTHASVMTVHAAFDDSSPTARGSLVLDNLICQPIPLPNIDIPELPDPVPTQTNRERFEQHTSNPACASCHSIIDPIGFALEAFDAVGAYREVYAANGEPVDTVGGLNIGDPVADGEAIGAQALSDRLLASEAFASCFVTQWMRMGLQRELEPADLCVRDALLQSFKDTNYDIRALILSFVTSEAFRASTEGA